MEKKEGGAQTHYSYFLPPSFLRYSYSERFGLVNFLILFELSEEKYRKCHEKNVQGISAATVTATQLFIVKITLYAFLNEAQFHIYYIFRIHGRSLNVSNDSKTFWLLLNQVFYISGGSDQSILMIKHYLQKDDRLPTYRIHTCKPYFHLT